MDFLNGFFSSLTHRPHPPTLAVLSLLLQTKGIHPKCPQDQDPSHVSRLWDLPALTVNITQMSNLTEGPG